MKIEDATHIEVNAGVRYWEDATVNGLEDTTGAFIPGRDGDAWKVRIDLRKGIIENWPENTLAKIHYKVCDEGLYWLTDAEGKRLAKWRGYYVPDDFLCHGDEGFGDYIIMNVGPEGHIRNFTPPEIGAEDWVPL